MVTMIDSNKRNLPAHERVVHIFNSRIIIAAKWEKSPNKRKIFIFCGCCCLLSMLCLEEYQYQVHQMVNQIWKKREREKVY